MAVPPGTRFGPYEVQSPLGAGGMGEVYRALDTRLGRIVALKVLPAHLCGTREARERFDREARAISSVSHPSICHLYDVGSENGVSYLVMEYLEGETLAARLSKGPLPLEPLLKMAIEMCEGLEMAHRRGVVHRDLKPANIFILPDGHAKLLDFGLAIQSGPLASDATQAAEDSATLEYAMQVTSPGSAVGTIAYMSPEQARGENVDGRSDLFSLGVVIYEMATGCRPFAGPSSALVFDAILNRQPRPIAEISPELPPALARAVSRLMAKNPQDRFASAKEVSEALIEIQQGRLTTSSGRLRVPARIPSIAVLPFTNLSADPDSHYFSDGLSEDLISALARLQGLQVASRTSAFRFRDGNTDIRDIGRQLSVEAVLEGSVRRSAQRLRITAQLVSVADGYHLWSERYDREIKDLFEIQDEITASIIKTLEPTLLGQQPTLTRRHSENMQAYDLYLKGRRFWDQRSESSLRAGLECFRAAIDLDPDYALAYLGIADSFSILAVYGYMSLNEGRPRAEAAMKKALDLNPELPECHFSMGMSVTIFGRRGEAEQHFRKSLEIQPRSSMAHAYLGLYLATQHRPDEAVVFARTAAELDPLSPLIHGLGGLSLQCCGYYEESLRASERALELQPNFILGLWSKQLAACHLNRWSEAIEAGERVVSVTRRSAMYTGQLAMVYGMAGHPEKALPIREELVQRQQAGEYINPVGFLALDTGLGHLDAVRGDILEYLEDGGNGWGLEIVLGSYLDELAKHPACREPLAGVGRRGST